MPKVLKAVADWIESSEMEHGPSLLLGRSEATYSRLERTLCLPCHALLGVFRQYPSHSPRKSPGGTTSAHMPPVLSSGGNQAPNFSKVKHQGSPEVQENRKVVMYSKNPCGVDNCMWCWDLGQITQGFQVSVFSPVRCEK